MSYCILQPDHKCAMTASTPPTQHLFRGEENNAASSKLLMFQVGMCEAEEDAKCLLVRTVERGLERDSLLVFWLLSATLQPWSGPLITLVAEKRSNTTTLLHSLSSLWNNACCHPPDTPGLAFLHLPIGKAGRLVGLRWASVKSKSSFLLVLKIWSLPLEIRYNKL